MSNAKNESGSGCGGFIVLIVVGFLISMGYNSCQERKREAEWRQQQDDATEAFLGGLIRGVFSGGGSGSAIGREVRGPDNGIRSPLDMPSGMSGTPSSMTVGPNGERYYNYDRITPP